MKIVADFHIHSPFARAVSRDMTLENLDNFAGIKGITVIGTGDFTHPAWIKEIKAKLEPAEPGLYKLKVVPGLASHATSRTTRFILTVEISSIYSKGGRVRRIHSLIFMPSIEAAEKFNTILGWQANLKSDGRPIVGIGAKELLKMALDACPDCFFVPAHVWTPWFSLFGSKSGFDALEECFDEYSKHIYALETGLSSDPAMNWRLSALDKYALISNSDSHSLRRLGREANIIEADLSYQGIISAIKSKNAQRFISTIEYFPEEGMYHHDGHRACGVRLCPQETKAAGGLCSVCARPVTVGVASRVEKMADRPEGFKPSGAIPFRNMVPLDEIVAESLGMASATGKNVGAVYKKLVGELGNELAVLFDCRPSDIAALAGAEVAEGIMRVREGKLYIEPGFDGQYGKVKIFQEGERLAIRRQAGLFA